MSYAKRTGEGEDRWRTKEGAAVAAAVAALGKSLDALTAAIGNGNGEDARDGVVEDATTLVLDVPIALALYSTQMIGLGVRPSDKVTTQLDELRDRLDSGSARKHETLSRTVAILALQAAQVHEALAVRTDTDRVH